MKNLTGTPITVGAVVMRAATGYIYGGVTYYGTVQRQIAPDHWSRGRECRHRHSTAEAALACAEDGLRDEAAGLRLLPGGRALRAG